MNAITIENISKFYSSGEITTTLRKTISNVFRPHKKQKRHLIRALDHISLNIAKGEVLGILGFNGSGKTTLLSLVAGIQPPSTGQITRNGECATLLQVGIGFDIEFTGHENIIQNAQILGMSKKEVQQKYNHIVQFAEVPHLLNTPTKRYSNCERTRLAFSIAVHVTAPILLIDEALVNGDTAFQQKARYRMRAMAASGATVLLVSQDESYLEQTCHRIVWLDKGKIAAMGNPTTIVTQFRNAIRTKQILEQATQIIGGGHS